MTLGGVPIASCAATWHGGSDTCPRTSVCPTDLSAREYLDYYALLYDIGPEEERRQRVQGLLEEVGSG